MRPNPGGTAEKRVLSSLKQRFILPKSQTSLDKLQCLDTQLEGDNLGLDASIYEQLQEKVSTIIHVGLSKMIGKFSNTNFVQAAWPVNFSLPLRAFEPSLKGLKNLLHLPMSSSQEPRFIFCSSTAAVLGPNHPSIILETISTSIDDPNSLGYSKSKWVAESICSRVAESLNRKSTIKVVRIGQLTGDSNRGVWNMSEAYPLMLSTVKDIGGLPGINDKLSWLPLDVAAKTVCEISLAEESSHDCEGGACEVYHVVNNDTSASFPDLLQWLGEVSDEPFEIMEPQKWLERLEKLENHPAKALQGLWKRAYSDNTGDDSPQVTTFDTRNAEKVSETMRSVSAVDKILFEKIWKWCEGELGKKD